MKTTKNPRFALCRGCGSRLDERVRTRGRHWNCELSGWQRDRDDTRAAMGERHLISTGVRWHHCGCGGWVLAAIAEGITEAVDPAIVDERTELNALLQGRHSFDLIRIANRTELMRRDSWRQRTREYPVVLGHNCGHIISVADPIDSWKTAAGKKAAAKKTTTQRRKPAPETGAAQPPPF